MGIKDGDQQVIDEMEHEGWMEFKGWRINRR